MAIDFPPNPETGDIYETAGTVYTWAGDRWVARSYQLEYPVPIYTNMVLTTPKDQGTELTAEGEILETQEQVNDLLASAANAVARATSRAADQVDFLQNSVGKGTWLTGEGVVDDDDYPGPGEFWANGTEFNAITKFKFNDSGLPGFTNPGTLEGSRVGDYLTVQTNDNNSFGQYVIKGLVTENVGKAGVIIRTMDVSLIRDARSLGQLHPLDRCSVTVCRPMSVIVQDNQPVVSTRGIFWYREGDDHLLISNYADGFTGEGPQWTDLSSGDAYLPLSGGTLTGNLKIDQESGTALNIKKGGVDKVKVEHGGRIFCAYDLSLDSDSRTVTTKGWVNSEIRAKGDERYLQLKEGGKIEGYVQFQDDTKLQMGGTYNNNIIDGKEGFTDNSIVATLGYVGHEIRENLSIGSLSPRDKMYLQGFYPWRVGEGSQISNDGDFLAKKSDYNVDLDPSTWRYLYFSVVDAYGQDLAGTFMNHMDMDKQRELFVWFARENGTKIFTIAGKMKCRDQNFGERFNIDIDASDKDLVVSKSYDTVPLEITRGEILWIKCSAWGN